MHVYATRHGAALAMGCRAPASPVSCALPPPHLPGPAPGRAPCLRPPLRSLHFMLAGFVPEPDEPSLCETPEWDGVSPEAKGA